MKIITLIFMMAAAAAYGQGTVSPLPYDTTTSAKTNTVDVTIKGKRVQFTDYCSTTFESWRFIHDGKTLLSDVFLTGGLTYSHDKIVECKTLDLATNEIVRLNLKVSTEQWQSISNLVSQSAKEKEIAK